MVEVLIHSDTIAGRASHSAISFSNKNQRCAGTRRQHCVVGAGLEPNQMATASGVHAKKCLNLESNQEAKIAATHQGTK